MAELAYNHGLAYLLLHGWSAAHVLLLDDAGTYVPNKDHATLSALTLGSNELACVGYLRKALASETASADDSADTAAIDAADVVWTALGPNTAGPDIQAAVVYFQVGGSPDDTVDVPLFYYDTGFPRAVNGADLTIHWNTAGLARAAQGA